MGLVSESVGSAEGRGRGLPRSSGCLRVTPRCQLAAGRSAPGGLLPQPGGCQDDEGRGEGKPPAKKKNKRGKGVPTLYFTLGRARPGKASSRPG